MSTSFISHAVLLKKLFDRRFQYAIPIYQRPYSWTKKESTRLFDDIVDAMGEQHGSFELDSFFLGALILTSTMDEAAKKPIAGRLIDAFNSIVSGKKDAPSDTTQTFDVVDGKQRLVTLKILLCLLRDLSTNGYQSSFEKLIGNGEGNNLYRLNLCGEEAELLEKHILREGASLVHVADQKELSDSGRKMIEVRDALHKNLLDLSALDRVKLLDYIVNHCEVVIILSEKIDHAFQIFQSINDTGAKLTGGDILKAELMAELTPAEVDDNSEIWEQWNDSLGEARGKAASKKKTFFNHFRYVLASNPSNILADFRIMVDKAGGAQSFIDDYLIPNIKAYKAIISAEWPAPQNKQEMDLVLGSLNWLPHDDWIAPAMLAMTRFGNDPDALLTYLHKLERMAYGLLILPGGYPDRRKKYNPIKRSLREPDGKKYLLKEVEFNAAEKKVIRETIEKRIHKIRPAAARIILLRIDMELTGRPISYYNDLIKEEGFSVEHLLPHKPEKNSQWLVDFSDNAERISHTELLGNLFLVREKTENPQMGNQDYIKKHAILFGSNQDHPIHLTNELRTKGEWKQPDIAQRQERLMTIIDKMWD